MSLPADSLNQIVLLEWQEKNPVQSRLGATGRPFTQRQAIRCRMDSLGGTEATTDGQEINRSRQMLFANLFQRYFPVPGSPFGAVKTRTALTDDCRVICSDGRSFDVDYVCDPDGDADHLEASLSVTGEGEGGTYDLASITVAGCLPVPAKNTP